MMDIMAKARGASVCAMDDRYCVDNGAMIAYAGVLEYLHTFKGNENKDANSSDGMPLMDCTFT